MDNQALMQQRTSLFRNAAAFKPVEHIPHLSFFVTWKVLDGGYTLNEGLRDYEIMAKCIKEHQEKYNFDAIFELGVRNIIRMVDHLGGGTYIVTDDAIEYKDNALVTLDELDDYIADPFKFIWEEGMKKKYPKWADGSISVEDIQKSFDEQKAFIGYFQGIVKSLMVDYGIPTFTAQSVPCYPGIDFLFNSVLGIKNLSVAMRRMPEKVDDAVKASNQFFQLAGIAALSKREGPNPAACFDYDIALLVHTILNNKQFERWLWPDLKPQLDLLQEKNMTTRLFLEGSSKPFWDYLKDYNKGIITMHPETDDVFEMRKALPNCAILGGMPVELLGYGSKDACVDRAKKLVDELGGLDGGFILSQDKMVTYRQDAKPENVKAVSDFILGYKG